MNARILSYDWFKFIILLILIALLITLGRCAPAGPLSAGSAAGTTAGEADQTAGETTFEDSDNSESAGRTTAGDAESDTATQTAEPANAESEVSAETASPNCPKALPARISGFGSKAKVTNALIPLRASPQVAVNILGALPIGSLVEITSPPVCTEYLDGANLWWGVRTSDGRTGFAAEGSAISATYYLEEVAGSD